MDNPVFITYHVKLFPNAPRKLQISSQLDSLVGNRDLTKGPDTFSFKSSRKLQQYRLIRFTINFLKDIFVVRLIWVFWKQYQDETRLQNKYWQPLLRLLDKGVYEFLKITDLGFIIIAFPIVTYVETQCYNLRNSFMKRINIFMSTNSSFWGWLETQLFQNVDLLFAPIYKVLVKISFIKINNNTEGGREQNNSSNMVKIFQLLMKNKIYLISYVINLIIPIFTTPFNYIIHINDLLNYQLSHQSRLNIVTLSRIFQNVAIQIWLEAVSYFGGSEDSS